MDGDETVRALLLVNPKARSGDVRLDRIRAVLREGGVEAVTIAPPGERDALTALIRERADEVDRVIVGGGDGTINSALRGLVDTGLPLGILPLGTANDLARTLRLPRDPVAAARLIAAGRTRRIDLGEVNGRLYFNVASVGFSAELARRLTRAAKKRWGVLGYAVASAGILRESRTFTARLEHGGRLEEVETLQISVGNGRHYGGGMTVEQSAAVDDGRLDVYSLQTHHWARLLWLLPALRRGTHGRERDVHAFSCTEVVVHTDRPRPINADGELLASTPATFRVRPGILEVFAPRP
jgi:YegS/Rv2252/BmrU family lipid kinase